MWAHRHVVVGVTGGIAAYKTCYLVRRLVDAGAQVDVAMTAAAMEFVRPLTFEALSGRPVITSLWETGRALDHVRLGREASVLIIAPATADFLARVAHGMADDFLSATVLASTSPIVMAPAMNDAMYDDPATRANVEALVRRGIVMVGPERGALAEGPSDQPGRMSEPDVILHHATRACVGTGALRGRRVVVTAGPTREPLDPVRTITNRSSGKMGYRLAQAAWHHGADVILIAGPSQEPVPVGVQITRIETTADLDAAVRKVLPEADVLIMAAAPSDFRPAHSTPLKRARADGGFDLRLEPTTDILADTISRRKSGALIVGFALETGDALAKGRAKLDRKQLQMIVINDALQPGAGFEVETNRVTVVHDNGTSVEVPFGSKSAVADHIVRAIEGRLG